jgi:hypothetical protein
MGAIFILLAVGALIGTWNLAGTIPTVVDYGIRVLNPSIFFLATAAICCSGRHGHGQLVDDCRNARRRVRRDGEGDGALGGSGSRRRHLRRLLRRQDDPALRDHHPRPEPGWRRPHRRPAHSQHVLDCGAGAPDQSRHLPPDRAQRRAPRRGQHRPGPRDPGERLQHHAAQPAAPRPARRHHGQEGAAVPRHPRLGPLCRVLVCFTQWTQVKALVDEPGLGPVATGSRGSTPRWRPVTSARRAFPESTSSSPAVGWRAC